MSTTKKPNEADRQLFARYDVPDYVPTVWPRSAREPRPAAVISNDVLRGLVAALTSHNDELLADNAGLRAARYYYRQRFLCWRCAALIAAALAVAWMLFWVSR